MTTKILTGVYSAGYVLSPNFTGLDITAPAFVGGIGVIANAAATITNAGSVIAAGGVAGGAGQYQGGAGAMGIDLAAGGRVTNLDTIAGGSGGAGAYKPTDGQAYGGGRGGVGVRVQEGGEVVNHGGVVGGQGGAGGATSRSVGGAGAIAGDGLELMAGGLFNDGHIAGGAGGAGGYGYGRGGAGGMGGAGVSCGGPSCVNRGTIVGGQGGGGGDGYYGDGAGGMGGAGLSASATLDLTNTASITGGAGGDGGGPAKYGFGGGVGGDGALLMAGGSVIDSGALVGGQGGAGKQAGDGGAGGAGVALQGAGSVTANRGMIAGGAGGAGGGAYSRTGDYGAGAGGRGGGGVELQAGGTIVARGAIEGGAGGQGGQGGGYGGVAGAGGAGGYGIALASGGELLNTGQIAGGAGGAGGYGGPQLFHSYPTGGGAGGSGGDGIDLLSGGGIDNLGTLAGASGGAGGAGYAGGVSGAVGASGDGVRLLAGGSVTNAAGGLIWGGIGVYAVGTGAVVVNRGTIAGTTNSVKFGSSSDVLIADGGAQFTGQIAGGGGTLELQGGTGTISGLGGAGWVSGTDTASFAGFGDYVIGAGGRWTLAGFNAVTKEESLTVDGALAVIGTLSLAATRGILAVGADGLVVFSGESEALAGTISGAGTVDFTSGSVKFNGATLSAAHMTICGASVTLAATVTNTGTVSVATPSMLVGAGGATLVGGTWALTDSASNKVIGLAAGDILDNVNATISGAGMLGGGQMVLINRAGAAIDGDGHNALIIDTGASQIATSGLIEAGGTGGVIIQSAMLNAGRLQANGGTLTVDGAVAGPHGMGVIVAGALVFNSNFAENVTFAGASGVLRLARSQTYTGAITGFSTSGGTSLDLGDIGFVSADEATFSGTATSGTLTVTDGTHTAHITLVGDFLGSTFTASSDGHGGTTVVDPAAPSRVPPPLASGAPTHQFIAGMAALGASGAVAGSSLAHAWREPPPTLLGPRTQTA